MRKEIKICLPLYKMAYAVFFTAILSIVRGVFYSYEIGIALEAPMALLAAAVLRRYLYKGNNGKKVGNMEAVFHEE